MQSAGPALDSLINLSTPYHLSYPYLKLPVNAIINAHLRGKPLLPCQLPNHQDC